MGGAFAFAISDALDGELPKREEAHYARGIVAPYIYDPSIPLTIVGAVLVPLASAFLVYQYFRYRAWFFWAAIIGIAMESIGFVARAVSAQDVQADSPFIVAFLMILLAPSFLAAACYTVFSRVVWFSCPAHALSFRTLWCFPRWITPTFVIFDLFSFAIQLVGSSMVSGAYDHDPSSDRSIESAEQQTVPGRLILVLGLVLQMSCFLTFAIIATRYFILSRKWRAHDLGDWKMWRRLSCAVNGAALLITLRALYRTMEIPHHRRTGLQYLQQHEWCFWTFDALPMFLVLLVFAVWHPGRYLPRSYTALALDKVRAVREKDELTLKGGCAGAGAGAVREFKPQDFCVLGPEQRREDGDVEWGGDGVREVPLPPPAHVRVDLGKRV